MNNNNNNYNNNYKTKKKNLLKHIVKMANNKTCHTIMGMNHKASENKTMLKTVLKRLFLFAVEIDDIVNTTYESIGDGTNNNNNNASSSPENSDDFVLVPNNLPVVDANAYDKK